MTEERQAVVNKLVALVEQLDAELNMARTTLEIIGGEQDCIVPPTTSALSDAALDEFNRLRKLDDHEAEVRRIVHCIDAATRDHNVSDKQAVALVMMLMGGHVNPAMVAAIVKEKRK